MRGRFSLRGPVAQGIEQRFPGPCVAGSNPAGPALLFLLKYGKTRDPLFETRPRYSYPYSHEGNEVAKKRGNGEGSVYRRKDGLWVGQYKVRTPNGNKTKYIYSKTRKDAATKLVKAVADRNSGVVYDSGNITVEDYLSKWLDSVGGTVRERTWRRSEEMVRIHLVPALGETRLDKLSALQVQALYRTKLESRLSARTVRMVHTTLHKAMMQAVRWFLIPRNVTEAVDPPRERGTEIRPLDEGQVKDLLRYARGERFEALYVLAVTTGMRSGELLELR
jgi:integrase